MRYGKLLSLGLLLSLAGFVRHEGRTPTRWALIVGINDYQNYGLEPGGDLLGAANDARNVYEVLTTRWGFEKQNIRMLLDLDATRDAIHRSFAQWLPSVVRPGDLVVFYYSGHGSQTWDKNGDEADGLDETICPTDVLRKSSARDIKDDELAGWVRALPTKNVTVILDSCHAGTATRAITQGVRTRSLSRDVRQDLAPEQPRVGTRSIAAVATPPKETSLDSFGEGVLEFAAARSDQPAIEAVFDGVQGRLPRAGGAFTTALVEHLWQVPLSATHEEVYRLAKQTMKRRNFAQDPQLSKLPTRTVQRLFALPHEPAYAAVPEVTPGISGSSAPSVPARVQSSAAGSGAPERPAPPAPAPAVAPKPEPLPEGAVPLLAVRGTEAELGGGSAAGMTEGSIYHVGDHVLRIRRVEHNRAHAEVITVRTRGIQAVGKPATPSPEPGQQLAAGMAAHLMAHRYPSVQLRVAAGELPQALRRELAQALRAVPAVVIQEDPRAVADLGVRPERGGLAVVGVDGSVRHRFASGSGATAIAQALRKELSALQVASLENPARPFALELAYGGADGQFKVGDLVEFRVRPGKGGYLTIVDVDAAGTVTTVFPNQWDGNNQIRAGQEISIPTPAMGFQFRAGEPVGRGVVRIFLTERPLGFPTTGPITAEQVAQALRAAAGPAPIPGSDALPVRNWATASVIYDVQH